MKTELQVVHFRGVGTNLGIGNVNSKGQRCMGTLGVPGTDHNAEAYKMECTWCGYVYGANSADVWQRRCPNCQGGAAGIRFWLIARKVAIDPAAADGPANGVRVEYDTEETGADWIDRTAGSMKDIPDADYEKFLEYCRSAREEMNHLPDEADGP